jgi:hypothetical protein
MRFQRDATALTQAGDAAPFGVVAREALLTESRYALSEAGRRDGRLVRPVNTGPETFSCPPT